MGISTGIPTVFGVDTRLMSVAIFSHLKVLPHSNFVLIFWLQSDSKSQPSDSKLKVADLNK